MREGERGIGGKGREREGGRGEGEGDRGGWEEEDEARVGTSTRRALISSFGRMPPMV